MEAFLKKDFLHVDFFLTLEIKMLTPTQEIILDIILHIIEYFYFLLF